MAKGLGFSVQSLWEMLLFTISLCERESGYSL